jgi:Zn-dependent protease with chaperone function
VHLILILLALITAYGMRLIPLNLVNERQISWGKSLFLFAFPPLLLVTTALAVLLMGYQGEMFGFHPSKFSYFLSLIFGCLSVLELVKLTYQGFVSLRKIRTYPQKFIGAKQVRFLDIEFPYTAQIGFWQPELIVSHGLIKLLTPQHLEAVLEHENAHLYYRDTFWFFWLTLLKNVTFWLPNTNNLWQELLLLRELRADQKAREKYDYLLLAESLLFVTQASLELTPNFSESFSCAFSNYRLQERIEALLSSSDSFSDFKVYNLAWFLLIFLPWFTLPFHN